MNVSNQTTLSYEDILKIASRYNASLHRHRKSHLPFLDNTTGIAQRHSLLYKTAADRLSKPQISYVYAYKPVRWRKEKSGESKYPVLVKSVIPNHLSSSNITGCIPNESESVLMGDDELGGLGITSIPAPMDNDSDDDSSNPGSLSTPIGMSANSGNSISYSIAGTGRRSRGRRGGISGSSRGRPAGSYHHLRGYPRRRPPSHNSPANTLISEDSSDSVKTKSNLPPPLLTNATLVPPSTGGGLRSQPPKLESHQPILANSQIVSALSPSSNMNIVTTVATPTSNVSTPTATVTRSVSNNNTNTSNVISQATPVSSCESVPVSVANNSKRSLTAASTDAPIMAATVTSIICCDFCHGVPTIDKESNKSLVTTDKSVPDKANRQPNARVTNTEPLIRCHDCERTAHPICLGFSDNMRLSVTRYRWQCLECKTCWMCGTAENDDEMLFCDDCDRGYHMYCLQPPLSLPPDGNWSCDLCISTFRDNAASLCGSTNDSTK